jgi:predicted transcriptional regulator YdeE
MNDDGGVVVEQEKKLAQISDELSRMKIELNTYVKFESPDHV